MLGAYRRRQRERLLALGSTIAVSLGEPQSLPKHLEALIPDLEDASEAAGFEPIEDTPWTRKPWKAAA